MTTSPFRFPKKGLYDEQGRLSKSGHRYLTGIEKAVSSKTQGFANTAERVMTPSGDAIRTDGFWQVMEPTDFQGGEIFSPDLGSRLDFICPLITVTTMRFPENIPAGALPFFSVAFYQDSVGGRPLLFDESLVGEPPEILDGPNDITLCGFKVMRGGVYAGWAVKGIPAVV